MLDEFWKLETFGQQGDFPGTYGRCGEYREEENARAALEQIAAVLTAAGHEVERHVFERSVTIYAQHARARTAIQSWRVAPVRFMDVPAPE